MSKTFWKEHRNEFKEFVIDYRSGNLPQKISEFVEECTPPVAFFMLKTFGGSSPYIPSFKDLELQKKRQYVINEFNGTNHFQLAQKMGMTKTWVYGVLRTHRNDQQHDLFEEVK